MRKTYSMASKKLFSKKIAPIGVSFLPQEKPAETGVSAYRKGMALIAFVAAVVLCGGVWAYYVTQGRSARGQIKVIERETAQLDLNLKQRSDEVRRVQALTRVIAPAKILFTRHILWSNFFRFVEEFALPDVKFISFSGDAKGAVLTGVAKDYETIARQMTAFKLSPSVKDIKVSGIASRVLSQGQMTGVNFTLTLALDEALFKP